MPKKDTLFNDTFGAHSLKEPFNRKAALYVQANLEDFIQDPAKRADAEDKIKSLLESSMGQQHNKVSYAKGKEALDGTKGRWYAKTPGAMQFMSRAIRHTLCKGVLIDLDLVNCHPSILLGLCKKRNIIHRHLERYVLDREHVIREMVEVGGVSDRNKAKELVLVALNGGSVTAQVHLPWWEEMCTEFAAISSAIANHADFQKFKCHTQRVHADEHNMNAKIVSAILCDRENHYLESLFSFLKAQGCILGDQCVLVFDGIMVADTPEIRGKVTDREFLGRFSSKIEEDVGCLLEVKVKEFDQAFELPEDYDEHIAGDVIVIERGHDMQAVDAFYTEYAGWLVMSKGRVFWYHDGIYHEGEKAVRGHIVRTLQAMNIMMEGKAQLLPYSSNARHLLECAKLIMLDVRFEQEDFVRELWDSNLGYLAFKNGVYHFETKTFLPYSAVEGKVYFTHKIDRDFPARVRSSVCKQLRSRVLNLIFKQPEQREYVLHCLARALAGCIQDKRWHVCMGERNSGKGVICDLLKMAFGPFVLTFNSENLLCSRLRGGGDAAKKQSWMAPLEFVRICLSNEIILGDGACKMDGNMVKRLASGGDEVEVRTNYKDEERKRLQCTAFMCCNECPPADPPDAYETLEVFSFGTKFVSQEEIDGREEGGRDVPEHWAPADPTIKGWIKNPDVIDAFTRIVLDAYSGPNRQRPPSCVIDDTRMFRGPSTETDMDRIGEILRYVDNPSKKVFSEQIKMALEDSGLLGTSCCFCGVGCVCVVYVVRECVGLHVHV